LPTVPETPALSRSSRLSGATAPPGTIVEICPAAAVLAAELAERLPRQPGAALFIDYGYGEGMPGSTLAAIGRHRAAASSMHPGTADLSAHVDFAAFAAAARAGGAAVYGPVPQGGFLKALGAELRLAALLRSGHAGAARRARDGARRLIDPAEMGTLFKALAVTSPGLPAPAGFADVACERHDHPRCPLDDRARSVTLSSPARAGSATGCSPR
jgi:NADH dehydrogenase [ubiquinone] 1 alpha subcomplex assembly factor 7